jgi:hypothetical protein
VTSRTVTVLGWVVLAAAAVALEVRARLSSGRLAGIADVFDRVIGSPAGRAVLLVAWLWTGWHVFAR